MKSLSLCVCCNQSFSVFCWHCRAGRACLLGAFTSQHLVRFNQTLVRFNLWCSSFGPLWMHDCTLVRTKTTGPRPLARGGLGPFPSEPKRRLPLRAFVEMDTGKRQVNMSGRGRTWTSAEVWCLLDIRAEENTQNMLNTVCKNNDV